MKRLYEWGIATESGGRTRLSPVGITDDEPNAQTRMLDALGAVPRGVPATGWVTVMDYVAARNDYDRFQTPVLVRRDQSGGLQWLVGGDKSASPVDPAGG